MSFIDEAAREINVKIVWYSASGTAAALVRFIGDRTQPDLKRQQALALENGVTVTHLQFVPAALGTLRGYATRFHLFAVETAWGAVEPDDVRLLVFRGADACVFVGGSDDAAGLAHVDGAFAAQGYTNIPIAFGADMGAIARGRALGFPDADCFTIDAASGTGVFDAFKAIAKKILSTLAGQPVVSRPTPRPGTPPLVVASAAPPAARTLEQTQEGLDAWQRGFHAKAIWVLGLEEARLAPSDVPEGLPAHTVHAVRLTSADGFAFVTNGFARTPASAGAPRLELRANASRDGWQIAQALSFLGRIAWSQVRDGGAPWVAYDLVTTNDEPLFGFTHFALAPAGTVRTGEETVTILRAIPISADEHREIKGTITGENLGAWLAARAPSMPSRWLTALDHDRPFRDA